jgi:predicted nucleic acid-binding protein
MAQEAVGAGADDGLAGAGHDVDREIAAQGPEGPPPQADAGPDNRKPNAEGCGVAGKCNGRAASLLEAGIRLVAPDLLIPEGNVLWKRRREMPVGEMDAIAIALTTACPVSLYSSSVLLEGALSLALAYDRSVYDSLYLAPALSEDCPLVKADERFSNALQASGLGEYIQVL